MHRMKLVIVGRVQGVFFRASAIEEAHRLGVTGWIRNTPTGAVELIAEGEDAALAALRRWCAHGPPSARVEKVQEFREDATGEFRDFGARS